MLLSAIRDLSACAVLYLFLVGCSASTGASDGDGANATQETSTRDMYIVMVSPQGWPTMDELQTDDGVQRAQTLIVSSRNAVLNDVFGSQGYGETLNEQGRPGLGTTFTVTPGFEMRLNADEVRQLSAHPLVIDVQSNTPARSMER